MQVVRVRRGLRPAPQPDPRSESLGRARVARRHKAEERGVTPLLDATARKRIHTSLDESLLIKTGARTGKTTVLVARVVEVLRTGYATIDELVVITFTEKTA